jgi:hypothetical protein
MSTETSRIRQLTFLLAEASAPSRPLVHGPLAARVAYAGGVIAENADFRGRRLLAGVKGGVSVPEK